VIFQNLSLLTVGLLTAGLAGALFLLHLLRIKPREVVVPTILFWKAALEERRRRRLFGHFRHPRTWAFLVLIAALLVLALSDPVPASALTDRHSLVLIVDRGASMGAAPGGAEGRSLLLEDLESVSLLDFVAVVDAGCSSTVAAGFDAPRATARSALERDGFDAGPPHWASALRLASTLLSGRPQAHVRILTDGHTPIDRAELSLLNGISHDIRLAAPDPKGFRAEAGVPPRRGPAAGSGRIFCRGRHKQALELLVASDATLILAEDAAGADLVVEVTEGTGPVVAAGAAVRVHDEVILFPEEEATVLHHVPAGVASLELSGDAGLSISADSACLASLSRGEGRTLVLVPWLVNPVSPFIRSARGARALCRLLRQGAGVRQPSRQVDAGRTFEVALADEGVIPEHLGPAGFIHRLDDGGAVRIHPADSSHLFEIPNSPAISGLYPARPPEAAGETAVGPLPRSGGGLALFEVLAFLAFGLLLLDAWLHLRGRIP